MPRAPKGPMLHKLNVNVHFIDEVELNRADIYTNSETPITSYVAVQYKTHPGNCNGVLVQLVFLRLG